jgi:hypothetical protein
MLRRPTPHKSDFTSVRLIWRLGEYRDLREQAGRSLSKPPAFKRSTTNLTVIRLNHLDMSRLLSAAFRLAELRGGRLNHARRRRPDRRIDDVLAWVHQRPEAIFHCEVIARTGVANCCCAAAAVATAVLCCVEQNRLRPTCGGSRRWRLVAQVFWQWPRRPGGAPRTGPGPA